MKAFKKERSKKKNEKKSEESIFDYFNTDLNNIFPPSHNPLEAFIEREMNPFLLKKYLSQLLKFKIWWTDSNYNKNEKTMSIMDNNINTRELFFIPSLFLKPISKNLSNEKFRNFINSLPKEKLKDKIHIGLNDFSDDVPFSMPEKEEILYYKSLEIIEKKLPWYDKSKGGKYSVTKSCLDSISNPM